MFLYLRWGVAIDSCGAAKIRLWEFRLLIAIVFISFHGVWCGLANGVRWGVATDSHSAAKLKLCLEGEFRLLIAIVFISFHGVWCGLAKWHAFGLAEISGFA